MCQQQVDPGINIFVSNWHKFLYELNPRIYSPISIIPSLSEQSKNVLESGRAVQARQWHSKQYYSPASFFSSRKIQSTTQFYFMKSNGNLTPTWPSQHLWLHTCPMLHLAGEKRKYGDPFYKQLNYKSYKKTPLRDKTYHYRQVQDISVRTKTLSTNASPLHTIKNNT